MCPGRGHKDTRKRFGIKFDGSTIGMNCFNCNFKTRWDGKTPLSKNFIEFLTTIGVPSKDIKKIQFELLRLKKGNDIDVQLISIERDITVRWTPTELPQYTKPLSFWAKENCNDENFLKVLQYVVEEREFDDLDSLYWTPVKEKQYNRRVLLPFSYRGQTVGYTARYCSSKLPKSLPKYINVMPSNYLYNLDEQNPDNEYLILCEGVFDAYSLKGVSPLHNSINEEQAKMILSMDKTVILTPHRDKAGMDLVDDAVKYGWAVSFPPWDRDIGDASDAVAKYGRIATLQSIIEHAEYNKLKIQLKRNLLKYD
jgi:hypothetical protein